ncbi:MAG TPA: hypothetical protein VMB71_10690, partial [Acetobacteraceae bacterium]|nr:hypothetical protein [Acetobacteraceae bacterium]
VDVAKGDRSRIMTEGESEYWAALSAAVGALHDPEALKVLLNPTVVEDGASNVGAIGAFGDQVLPRLLTLYDLPSFRQHKWYISSIITYMLEHHIITNDIDRTRLRTLFLVQSHDQDWKLRLLSLRALSIFNTEVARGRIREVAAADPYSTVNKKGTVAYPVRVEAARLLR